jgi:O-Antigen ligase
MTPEDDPKSHDFGYISPSAARRVEVFRGQRTRPPLHPAEKLLLWILGTHLCFLPWALGTMHPWSQEVSLGLAVLGFAVAVKRRLYGRELSGADPPFRLNPWGKLRRFPIFWIGLGLLLLVAIQGLNPWWRFVETSRFWWLVRAMDVQWLPAGIEAPFARFNVWRDFIIGASAWLTTCAVWIGLTRLRSLRILLAVLVINGLVLGGMLAAQHVTDDQRIPWPLNALTSQALNGSFIYRNHAGAYFALITFVAVALATWFVDHGARMLRKSTPGAALGLAAGCLGGAVFFTLSRGAALVLGISLVLLVGWLFLRRRRQPVVGANPAVTKIIVAVFVVFALVAFHYLDFSVIYGRWDKIVTERSNEPSVSSRILAHEAAGDMLRANWVRGVGAGGFRYLFPEYVKFYPEIYQGGQLYWEHAHGDWWEVPIELGLAGDLLLLGGAAWWASWFWRRRIVWHALAVPLLLGCAQTVFHAWFDFPFQCPAILTTWCVLVTVAGKWVELDQGA